MTQAENSKFVPALPDDDTSVKIYEGVAECTMNDADTIKNVKSRAKDLAQENLLKTIADYVDRFLKERLLTFPDDENLSVAEEIYHVTDVKYNVFDSDDDMMIRATVTAQVDDNDIMNCLVRFFKERTELKRQKDKISLSNKKLCEAIKSCTLFLPFGNPEEAIKLCNEAIQLNPNNDYAYYFRGSAYFNLEQYERAIQDYDKAIELKPNDSHYYSTRGNTYNYSLKQKERAIQDYDKAIELNPNYEYYYQNRGECYKKLGKKEKADADFKKAEELRKKS